MPPTSTQTTLGKGAILAYSQEAGSATTYINLTKVVSINPTLSVGEVEDVTLDSTFESYLPTIPAGECTFTIRHRPGDAGVAAIAALSLAPAVIHWKIIYPDGSGMTFDGFVKGYSKTFENKTIVDAEVPMRITTLPIATSGT